MRARQQKRILVYADLISDRRADDVPRLVEIHGLASTAELLRRLIDRERQEQGLMRPPAQQLPLLQEK